MATQQMRWLSRIPRWSSSPATRVALGLVALMVMLVLLVDAYDEEETVDVNGKSDIRTVLRLDPKLAPFKAAVLPLAKKPELTGVAKELFETLQIETNAMIDYDETANIGKRYRRQDAVGTPFCVTVDHQTLEDGTVTLRYRDSMKQDRVKIEDLHDIIDREVSAKTLFKKLMAEEKAQGIEM